VEAEKLDLEKAKEEYVNCVTNATYNLKNLEAIQEFRYNKELARLEKEAQEELESFVEYPFRKIAEVDEFLAQFQRVAKRRKFLVLDGDSGLGKSDFAKSLVPQGAALDLNCASCGDEPPLRGYFKPDKHKLILFDEASAQLVITNKKAFQGPVSAVQLGSSKTNMFTYRVLLAKKMLVISSNKWSEQVEKLEPLDRKWILENQIYVQVDAPLFSAPQSDPAPSGHVV